MSTSQADKGRVIKFRCWDGKGMMYSDQHFDTLSSFFGYYHEQFYFDSDGPKDVSIMQFTGLLDKHGKDIYEADIRREEIEHDEGDETYYCIMTYITEWSMFAWLNYTDGEYDTYLSKGAEALDTVMYWSYPAGQEKQSDVTVCGNLHQDKHLLK